MTFPCPAFHCLGHCRHCVEVFLPVADPDIPFRGGGHWGLGEMRLNVKGTVGNYGGRKLIYNNSQNIAGGGGGGGSRAPGAP